MKVDDMVEETYTHHVDQQDKVWVAADDAKPTFPLFSGSLDGQWVTRFDTLAHRSLHTVDPVFDYIGERSEWHMVIIADEAYEGSAIWFWLPLLGTGIARRRRS